MTKDIDEQVIDQIKKIQKKIDELEKRSSDGDLASLQQEVTDLKAELIKYKESRTKKVDFGDW